MNWSRQQWGIRRQSRSASNLWKNWFLKSSSEKHKDVLHWWLLNSKPTSCDNRENKRSKESFGDLNKNANCGWSSNRVCKLQSRRCALTIVLCCLCSCKSQIITIATKLSKRSRPLICKKCGLWGTCLWGRARCLLKWRSHRRLCHLRKPRSFNKALCDLIRGRSLLWACKCCQKKTRSRFQTFRLNGSKTIGLACWEKNQWVAQSLCKHL